MNNVIHSDKAPAAIGPYSQAIRTGNIVFFAGQIPLDPTTMELVPGDFSAQAEQVFKNIEAVLQVAGGNFDGVVKLTCFLTDLSNAPKLNEVMQKYLKSPFPARSTIGVASLPKNALVEVEAILALD